MIEYTGCAGVMIGRGALSMPWIFRDTWSYLTTGIIPPPPTIEQKCQLMRDHFHNIWPLPQRAVGGAGIPQADQLVRQADAPVPDAEGRDAADQHRRPISRKRSRRFLDWRHQHDDDVRAGRVAALEDGELVEAA